MDHGALQITLSPNSPLGSERGKERGGVKRYQYKQQWIWLPYIAKYISLRTISSTFSTRAVTAYFLSTRVTIIETSNTYRICCTSCHWILRLCKYSELPKSNQRSRYWHICQIQFVCIILCYYLIRTNCIWQYYYYTCLLPVANQNHWKLNPRSSSPACS